MNDVKRVEIITWHAIELTVEHTPNWAADFDHIQVASKDRVALPITETGYKSHFLPSDQITDYGDAVDYVLAWLDYESKSKSWKNAEAKTVQLSLF